MNYFIKKCNLMYYFIKKCSGNRLTCTVWDDHVAKIEPYYNCCPEEPLVVLIQFCRARLCLNSKFSIFLSHFFKSFFLRQQYTSVIYLLAVYLSIKILLKHYVPALLKLYFAFLWPLLCTCQPAIINKLFLGGEVKVCSSYDVTQILFNEKNPVFQAFKDMFSLFCKLSFYLYT